MVGSLLSITIREGGGTMSLCSTLRIGPEPEGNFYSRVEGKSFDHGIKNSLVSLSLTHSRVSLGINSY